jgi:hypothetical protein
MPNNVNFQTSVVYPSTYINYSPVPQQGFGWVTTNIFTFFTTNSFAVTSSAGMFNIYGVLGSAALTGSSIDVSDYNNNAFQFGITGSGTATYTIYSTIDGYNWELVVPSTTVTAATSSINRITGRRRYFQANVSCSGASPTASLILISGQ